MVQKVLRALTLIVTIALFASMIATSLPSTASANICQDFFDTRPVRSLAENEFGVFYFNNGAGRNFLSTGYLMGTVTEGAVTYLTMTADSGGLRHFDSTMVFTGVEPVRVRALVTNPNKGLAATETRMVTLIGERKNPQGGEPQYIGRLGDHTLVRVVRIEE